MVNPVAKYSQGWNAFTYQGAHSRPSAMEKRISTHTDRENGGEGYRVIWEEVC